MLSNNPFYHQTTRKIVSAFGTMFNNIWLVKYDANMMEVERIKVPLSFAQKEKFILQLAMDVNQDKPTQVSLPRMSFEWTGMMYDPVRKLPSLNQIISAHPTDKTRLLTNYTPVPYNFSFSLNIYTRNIEDMSQIIEQIVPYFTPDFTVPVSLVGDGGQHIQRDIPITLDSVTPQIEYEGNGIDPRYVTCAMAFTVQAYLFGPTSNSAIIRKAITNIYDTVGNTEQINIVVRTGGSSQFRFEEEVFSGNNWISADWRGRILAWNANTLRLSIYEVSGDLPKPNDVVYGVDSEAKWTVSSVSRSFIKHAETTIVPVPNTAQPTDANLSFKSTTTEFPNVADP